MWGHQAASPPDPATEPTQPGGGSVPGTPAAHQGRPPSSGWSSGPVEAAPRGRVSQGSFPTNAPRMWLGSPKEPNGKPLRLPHPAPPPGRPARPLPCPGHQGPWGSTAHRCPLASTFSLLVPLLVSPSALKGQPPDGRPRPAAPRLCGSPHTLCCPLSMLGWLPTPARLRPLLGHILDRAPRGAGRPGSGVGGPTPAGGRLCPVGQHTLSGQRAECTRVRDSGRRSRAWAHPASWSGTNAPNAPPPRSEGGRGAGGETQPAACLRPKPEDRRRTRLSFARLPHPSPQPAGPASRVPRGSVPSGEGAEVPTAVASRCPWGHC